MFFVPQHKKICLRKKKEKFSTNSKKKKKKKQNFQESEEGKKERNKVPSSVEALIDHIMSCIAFEWQVCSDFVQGLVDKWTVFSAGVGDVEVLSAMRTMTMTAVWLIWASLLAKTCCVKQTKKCWTKMQAKQGRTKVGTYCNGQGEDPDSEWRRQEDSGPLFQTASCGIS